MLTVDGSFSPRAKKRLPSERRWDARERLRARGLPWSVREGVDEERVEESAKQVRFSVPAEKETDKNESDDASKESSLKLGPSNSSSPDRTVTGDEEDFEEASSIPRDPISTQAEPKKQRVDPPLRKSPRAFEGDSEQAAKKLKAEVSHVNNVQDWSGSQIPEDELREARIAELRTLMGLGAFKAVREEEDCGKQRCPFKSVDKRKDFVVKSPFTVAGVKSQNPDKAQQETTTMAGTMFEVLTLEREFASVTMDVVSAYPQAKEKEDVYVRIPNKFGEAVISYEATGTS